MTKETFTDLSSLVNAPANINGIVTEIEVAFDNTLSRDGSSPNTMAANLDMNSHRILNLPAPVDPTEPMRMEDISTFQVYTVAALSALTLTRGYRAFVSDSTVSLSAGLGGIVAGSGSNFVPVYYDGTNIRIG